MDGKLTEWEDVEREVVEALELARDLNAVASQQLGQLDNFGTKIRHDGSDPIRCMGKESLLNEPLTVNAVQAQSVGEVHDQ